MVAVYLKKQTGTDLKKVDKKKTDLKKWFGSGLCPSFYPFWLLFFVLDSLGSLGSSPGKIQPSIQITRKFCI